MNFFCFHQTKNVEFVYFNLTKNIIVFLPPPNKNCGISLFFTKQKQQYDFFLLQPDKKMWNKSTSIKQKNIFFCFHQTKEYDFFCFHQTKTVELVYFHQTKEYESTKQKNMIFFCFHQAKNVDLVYFHQTKEYDFFLLQPSKNCVINLLPPNKRI